MKNITMLHNRSSKSFSVREWYVKLLFVFLVAQSGPLFAQTGTIGIGSGTDTDGYYMPLNTYYNYNYSQQIVLASEYVAGGGVAGPITKIRYYIDYADTPLSAWNNWTVYLGHTNKTSFTSDTDWVAFANLTQVYTGTITQVDGQWMEITFTTPFNYDGTSNIVIAVDENSPGYADDWTESYFGTYNTTEDRGLVFYSDVDNPDPASPPAAEEITDIVPRLQLVGTMASCLTPTALTGTSTSFTSGTVSYTASASIPANGYQYYQSTTNTPPTATTTATGTVAAGQTSFPITGLTANTTYYVWVRSVCSGTDSSNWVGPAVIYTGYCTPAPESVDGIGITNVTIGTINNTTVAETGNYGDYSAMSATYALGSMVNFSITYETGYTYNTSIWVDWNNDADFDDAGELVYTGVSTNEEPTTLSGSFTIPANAAFTGARRIRIGGTDVGPTTPCYSDTYGTFEDYTLNLVMPAAPVVTAFTPDSYCAATGNITITGTDLGNATLTIGGTPVPITTNTNTQIVAAVPAGVSGVVAVTTVAGTSTTTDTFTVTAPTALVLSSLTTTVCAGETSDPVTVTSGTSAYNSFVWAPATGVTGDAATGWTFSPAVTTVYTLTASNTTTGCVIAVPVTVSVNPLPTALVMNNDASFCSGGEAVALSFTGGITSGTILTENFNAATNNWEKINNSTGGTPEDAAWTLQQDGYDYDTWGVMHSNDNSQFYFTNSDVQGSDSVTSTILRSPAFSTTGYTSVNFSFYHFYNQYGDSTAKVEVSSNGTDWTTLANYTSDQGDYAAFNLVTLPLPAAFLNQPQVYVRFKFDGTYDLFWAVDNVTVSGQQTGTIAWSPAAGLYTDAAATVPYTNQSVATVYAMPTETTTYTATVTNVSGCSVSDEIVVNYSNTPTPTGTGTLTLCNGGTVEDLTAEGENIIWYTSDAGDTELADDVVLVSGTSYFATQTVNGCESQLRYEVVVTINEVAQPDGDTTQVVQEVEQGTATIADIDVTGDNLVWYASEEDALAGEDPLDETDLLVSGTTYWVTQTVGICTSTPLGITVTVQLGRNNFDASTFKYYPNPVRNVLNISYSADIVSVTVYNLLGQQVLSKELNATTGTVDMTALQDGAYLVNVTSGDSVQTIKVIKKQ